jgi:hypothetical protein
VVSIQKQDELQPLEAIRIRQAACAADCESAASAAAENPAALDGAAWFAVGLNVKN